MSTPQKVLELRSGPVTHASKAARIISLHVQVEATLILEYATARGSERRVSQCRFDQLGVIVLGYGR